jgi:hypothetical protein
MLKESAIQQEAALKADAFRVTVRGLADELARARPILADANPSSLQLHHVTRILTDGSECRRRAVIRNNAGDEHIIRGVCE